MKWIKQQNLEGGNQTQPDRAPEGELVLVMYRFTKDDEDRIGIASYHWENWKGDIWKLHQVGAVELPFMIKVFYWMPLPETPEEWERNSCKKECYSNGCHYCYG